MVLVSTVHGADGTPQVRFGTTHRVNRMQSTYRVLAFPTTIDTMISASLLNAVAPHLSVHFSMVGTTPLVPGYTVTPASFHFPLSKSLDHIGVPKYNTHHSPVFFPLVQLSCTMHSALSWSTVGTTTLSVRNTICDHVSAMLGLGISFEYSEHHALLTLILRFATDGTGSLRAQYSWHYAPSPLFCFPIRLPRLPSMIRTSDTTH